MARWSVKAYDNDFQNPTLEFTVLPQNLHFASRHREAGMIEFDISLAATDPETGNKIVHHQFIKPYSTRWQLWRNNQLIESGWFTGLKGSLRGESVHVVGATWMDYFNHRHYPYDCLVPAYFGAPYVWVGEDAKLPIHKILTDTLARDYSIPFSWNEDLIGVTLPTYTLDLGATDTVYATIENFASTYPGFDWEVTPSRWIKFYSPHKYGTSDSLVPVWQFTGRDDGLLNLDLTNNGIEATHIMSNAPNPEPLGYTRGYTQGHQTYYRIDQVTSYDNYPIGQVHARTIADFAHGLNPRHELTIECNSEEIPLFWTIFEPGFAISIYGDLEWHLLNPSFAQILEIDCRVDNNANEHVTLKVQQIYDEPVGFEGTNEG